MDNQGVAEELLRVAKELTAIDIDPKTYPTHVKQIIAKLHRAGWVSLKKVEQADSGTYMIVFDRRPIRFEPEDLRQLSKVSDRIKWIDIYPNSKEAVVGVEG
jgi:hypothetical protein